MDEAQLVAQRIGVAPDWIEDTSIEYPAELAALLGSDDTLQIYGVFQLCLHSQ